VASVGTGGGVCRRSSARKRFDNLAFRRSRHHASRAQPMPRHSFAIIRTATHWFANATMFSDQMFHNLGFQAAKSADYDPD
jgi:hypothetical protein